jgi:two-component system NarL family sensor kinase
MLSTDEEIYIAVVSSAFLMVLLALVVVVAIVKYQNRRRFHMQEVSDITNQYQREILKAQIEMQEQTFRYISEEVHDNIGQLLTIVRINLSMMVDSAHLHKEMLANSKQLLDDAIGGLRSLSKRLNAEFVGQQQLSSSLKLHLKLIEGAGSHRVHFELHGNERDIETGAKVIIFRIVQEALNNILKHADAQVISIVLKYREEDIILRIDDDGKGFDVSELNNPDSQRKGVGTYTMRYRANLIGARFNIHSAPGEGTLVQMILPAGRTV